MIKMKVTELVFESEELEDCIKGFFFNEVILLLWLLV